jgi:hypothetical protein
MARRRASKRDQPYEPLDVERFTVGMRRTETKRGGTWTVQPIAATNATKTYICPGCSLEIEPGVAHIAAWRQDGILGDQADIDSRRHWHNHCWRIG